MSLLVIYPTSSLYAPKHYQVLPLPPLSRSTTPVHCDAENPNINSLNRGKKQKDGPDEGRTRDLGVISTTL